MGAGLTIGQHQGIKSNMALQLDLEEQEQLDQLKHFWKQWGNLISWILIGVMGVFAAWNGWNYWQRHQAAQAAVMFDEVSRIVVSKDPTKIERAFADMKDKFAGHALTQQAGLMSAQSLYQADKVDAAIGILTWVAEQAGDEAYQAIAKLRLAALYLDKKAHAQALQALQGVSAPKFQALVADRKGDILFDQGQLEAAKSEYSAAYKALSADTDYRILVEAKLNALGVDASTLNTDSGKSTSAEGKK
jgi:predicted negative regulator of RcsB-dependent stress response